MKKRKRTDRERLDWLDRKFKVTCEWWFFAPSTFVMKGRTIRKAIDAAMDRQEGKQ